MSSSDANSTTRPMRRRKSNRFDRSGGTPRVTGSTVIEDDADLEAAPNDIDESAGDAVAVTAAPEFDPEVPVEPVPTADPAPTDPIATSDSTSSEAASPDRRSDPSAYKRTLDQLPLCGRCGHEVSTITIEVDGNVLLMESCDNCDTRRWQLAGEPIELQQALDHVGEHTGRRR